MRYDYELSLIEETFTEDDIGNQIPGESKILALCGLKSIGRTEFYNAAAAGLKPEIILVMHGYEYNGAKQVEFEGKRYNVIRTYSTSFEEVELTCEKVIGNG